MADLWRVRALWEGWPGAPGYSNFYFRAVQLEAPNLTPVYDFFNALKAYFPIGLTIQVQGQGDTIDDTTGDLTGAWESVEPATVTGTGGGSYSGASGAVVEWKTSSIADNRRIQGRTYLVPIISTQYDSAGSLTPAFLTAADAAALAFVNDASNTFVIWHRPVKDPATGAITRDGSNWEVTGKFVPDLAAVMRSRRT